MIAIFPQGPAADILTLMVEHLADWPIKTAEAFRNAALEGMFAINPLLNIQSEDGIEYLRNHLQAAILEGRMIDFGFIPNEIIKAESIRSRLMYEAGEFMQPYENWLGISWWEGGCNGYYVCPNPLYPGETLVIELYGISIPDLADGVLVYDIVSIKVDGVGQTQVNPATMSVPVMQTQDELSARGANSLDPLVTMLRLLADASIPVSNREAPEKLNRARARKGKFPIPSHTVVDTHDYVASFHAAGPAGRVSRGGTHASPIPHWRRAHKRTLGDGRVIPVRSSKINWRDTEELHRLFYRIQKP